MVLHGKGSWTVSRVLCRRARAPVTVIPLGPRLPAASSSLPEGWPGQPWRPPIWPCSGRGLPSLPRRRGNWWALAPPFHPCLRLCAASAVCFLWHFPGIAPPGGYPASCPVEPGLSSPPLGRGAATVRPTPQMHSLQAARRHRRGRRNGSGLHSGNCNTWRPGRQSLFVIPASRRPPRQWPRQAPAGPLRRSARTSR